MFAVTVALGSDEAGAGAATGAAAVRFVIREEVFGALRAEQFAAGLEGLDREIGGVEGLAAAAAESVGGAHAATAI